MLRRRTRQQCEVQPRWKQARFTRFLFSAFMISRDTLEGWVAIVSELAIKLGGLDHTLARSSLTLMATNHSADWSADLAFDSSSHTSSSLTYPPRGFWYIYPYATRHIPHLPTPFPVKAFLMSSSPTLQQLDLLDRSSPDFHDQLSNVLYGQEYQQCIPNLQGEDLVWLVDYLDKVRCHTSPFLALHLSQPRLSVASILPVPLSGNVYASSEAYVALGGYSQHRTHFRLTSSTSIATHLPRGVMLTCTREPSMAQGFASNVCGYILRMVQEGLPRCVTDTVVFRAPFAFILMRLADLLPRGRYVETLDSPKRSTITGCYDHTLPANLKSDVGWGPAGIH
jgi:hypothetical protein